MHASVGAVLRRSACIARSVVPLERGTLPIGHGVHNRSKGAGRTSVRMYSAGSPLTAKLKDDMKAAMKAKDQPRLDAIRMINAAIKQREIEMREKAGADASAGDAEVVKVIQKLAKQRKDSIQQYESGGRADLADKEKAELVLLESYLPAQVPQEELEQLVAAAVAETGASTVKQMGQVMKAVQAKLAGRSADNALISQLVKAKLSG